MGGRGMRDTGRGMRNPGRVCERFRCTTHTCFKRLEHSSNKLGASSAAGYRPSIEKGLCSVHAQKWEEEQARLENEDHTNYSLVQDLLTEAAQLDGHTQALHDLVRADAATPADGRAVGGCGWDATLCREHGTVLPRRRWLASVHGSGLCRVEIAEASRTG
jgi:hypothetical protein